MGKPAARIGDHHVCPMVTGVVPHVGGPVVTAQPNVLIAGRPAARIGDNLVCAGPPDTIAQGEPTVLIGGKPAARLGDSTVHGGKIVIGAATVLIGGDNSVTLPNWRIKKHNDPSLRPKMEDGSFKTRREVDMKNLSDSDRKVKKMMQDQGRPESRIHMVLSSAHGDSFESVFLKKGDKIYGFTTEGRDKKIESEFWLTEADYLTMKAKSFCLESKRWDSHELKEKLALPCFNRANEVSVAEVTEGHEAVRSRIGPATENIAYVEVTREKEGPFDYMPKAMPGGGYQLTPNGNCLKGISGVEMPKKK